MDPQPWHCDRDRGDRCKMMSEIVALLEKTRPRLAVCWQEKLPSLLQKLEEALYRRSSSKEEYCDTATLDDRIKRLASELRSNPRFSVPTAPLDASEATPPSISDLVFVNSSAPSVVVASWVYRD